MVIAVYRDLDASSLLLRTSSWFQPTHKLCNISAQYGDVESHGYFAQQVQHSVVMGVRNRTVCEYSCQQLGVIQPHTTQEILKQRNIK